MPRKVLAQCDINRVRVNAHIPMRNLAPLIGVTKRYLQRWTHEHGIVRPRENNGPAPGNTQNKKPSQAETVAHVDRLMWLATGE